ncbi:SDR family oxidoreductase [Chryseobacterium wangxinyae]|uniref:SDR family oxidoreductase n=1 Tax=Chryseobacterium sp. CY350 TaxID=2997336 RepID=UPI0022720180|nr:SDR family oxidoreductase [Chryseobacterium sp. CY350]MCY0977126.1 SDR family oxidoreductase [Chryseobacterium sp. CY350]WBZ95853.1 SDR family oxidoreductase [Chryseobacterium sp. CY350]
MILITGATGNLGNNVIHNLLKKVPASGVAALVRNTAKAKSLEEKGIKICIGDYNDKSSLVKAMQGITKLFLVSIESENSFSDHKNVIDVAKESGVKHIYYTGGALNKQVTRSMLGSLTDSYITTENYIINSGLTYTIFQNGLYAETIPFFIGYDAVNTGITFPAGDAKATFAKSSEMAEAIANVLASNEHDNRIYLLTGSPTYSFQDIAEILSELSGKSVSYNSPLPEDYEAKLKEYGVTENDIYFSSLLAAIIRNHEYDVRESDLEELLDRRPTDLKIYLEETFLA